MEQDLQEINVKPMMKSKKVHNKLTWMEWFQIHIPSMLDKWMKICYFLRQTGVENAKLKQDIVLLREFYHQLYQAKTNACKIGELLLAWRNPSWLYSIFINEKMLRWNILRGGHPLFISFHSRFDYQQWGLTKASPYLLIPKQVFSLLCVWFEGIGGRLTNEIRWNFFQVDSNNIKALIEHWRSLEKSYRPYFTISDPDSQ